MKKIGVGFLIFIALFIAGHIAHTLVYQSIASKNFKKYNELQGLKNEPILKEKYSYFILSPQYYRVIIFEKNPDIEFVYFMDSGIQPGIKGFIPFYSYLEFIDQSKYYKGVQFYIQKSSGNYTFIKTDTMGELDINGKLKKQIDWKIGR